MTRVVAIAGLLHDIGKFSQRVGNEQRWRHEAFTENFLRSFSEKLGEEAERITKLAATHHQEVTDRESLCVKVADFLASAERQRKPEQLQIPPERTALLALPSRVELKEKAQTFAFLPLSALTLDENSFFPSDQQQVDPEGYRRLWDEFAETLRNLPSPVPFLVWQTLLQVYTHAIPSATPWAKEPEKRTVPDISLFHHARLTAAIATCLAVGDLSDEDLKGLRDLLSKFEKTEFLKRLREDELAKKPLCLLVRGDLAGIQSWLYRIARAEGETHRQTAKRLRGRSFFLALLTEAVARWLCRKAQMPPCNILFCGGGVFDVLLPANSESNLRQWQRELEDWLLDEFHGDLNINLAWVKVSAADFYDFGSVHRRIAAELERKKSKASPEQLERDGFWFLKVADICRFCDTTPFTDPTRPCEQCGLQRELGDRLGRLDRSTYLVWAWDGAQKSLKGKSAIQLKGLGCSVFLASEEDAQNIVMGWDGQGELTVAKRNAPKDWWKPLTWDGGKPVQATIWWAASEAPVAKRKWQAPTKHPGEPDSCVHEGETLDFDEIAGLSDGSHLLGVLRMDVDNLGTAFATGVEPRSPSRVAELSGRLDTFFSGWLRQRCYLLTRGWQNQLTEDDERKGLVDNAFYLVYAGGDDLMVIGPWNLTLRLAWHVHEDFSRYCGKNPNMTISAGIVFVKPKFPIHRFAVLAGEALERAKDLGRNRITAFGTTVSWDAYKCALDFGESLRSAVDSKEMPRTFLHFLWQLYRTHVRDEGVNPMWIPMLHYMVARRLNEKTVEKLRLLELIPKLIPQRALPIALGYAILATRRRVRVAPAT